MPGYPINADVSVPGRKRGFGDKRVRCFAAAAEASPRARPGRGMLPTTHLVGCACPPIRPSAAAGLREPSVGRVPGGRRVTLSVGKSKAFLRFCDFPDPKGGLRTLKQHLKSGVTLDLRTPMEPLTIIYARGRRCKRRRVVRPPPPLTPAPL
jgi:hypothetical protein